MGKKVNPNSFRLVINKEWKSQWFASDKKEEAKWLYEDDLIRKYLKKELKKALVSKIIIIRRGNKLINIVIHCVETGLILGQDGKNLLRLEKYIQKLTNYKVVLITLQKVLRPELNAQLVANEIARKIENRESYKRAQKIAISQAIINGAKGIKTRVSGRLGGHDMSRTEGYLRGVVPTQTLNEQVEYGLAVATTQYGLIGVKVWICIDPNNKIKERKNYRPYKREVK